MGGAAVKQIATQFGIGTDQAVSAASVLLPALAGGLQEKIATGKGSEISDLLSSGSLTRFVQSPSSLASPAAVELGNSLVSAIFGPGDPVNTEYRF